MPTLSNTEKILILFHPQAGFRSGLNCALPFARRCLAACRSAVIVHQHFACCLPPLPGSGPGPPVEERVFKHGTPAGGAGKNALLVACAEIVMDKVWSFVEQLNTGLKTI